MRPSCTLLVSLALAAACTPLAAPYPRPVDAEDTEPVLEDPGGAPPEGEGESASEDGQDADALDSGSLEAVSAAKGDASVLQRDGGRRDGGKRDPAAASDAAVQRDGATSSAPPTAASNAPP